MNRKNVLILDPERDVGDLFARALETSKNCKCYLTSKEEEALNLLKDISFQVLLVDIGMAMAGDFGLLKKVRRLWPDIIILAGVYLHQKDQVSKALEYGARGYIIKPITVDEFRKKIDEFYVWAEA
jgi:DNA-binding response OmpR family regulator